MEMMLTQETGGYFAQLHCADKKIFFLPANKHPCSGKNGMEVAPIVMRILQNMPSSPAIGR